MLGQLLFGSYLTGILLKNIISGLNGFNVLFIMSNIPSCVASWVMCVLLKNSSASM